jgi:hypothetical protein
VCAKRTEGEERGAGRNDVKYHASRSGCFCVCVLVVHSFVDLKMKSPLRLSKAVSTDAFD